MQIFSADAIVFSKKKRFDPEKMKKPHHNRPQYFFLLA